MPDITVTAELLDEIEAKAKAATPGPYYWCTPNHCADVKKAEPRTLSTRAPVKHEHVLIPAIALSGISKGDIVRLGIGVSAEIHARPEDEAYFVRCDPQTVLALVRRIRELEARR